jgi:hypothetical protein
MARWTPGAYPDAKPPIPLFPCPTLDTIRLCLSFGRRQGQDPPGLWAKGDRGNPQTLGLR